MKDNIDVKTESHLKITDITDKNKPRSIISKRLFNEKPVKKSNINNTTDIKPTQVKND